MCGKDEICYEVDFLLIINILYNFFMEYVYVDMIILVNLM